MRLRQIFNNLISNALKFTSDGAVEVLLAIEGEGDRVRLKGAVADSGPGVPSGQLELIFAPFQQTEEGVRRGGAGLGLAVCHQLVTRMGGHIGVRANAGGGALFEFEVPLDRTDPVSQGGPQVEPLQAEPHGGAVHVLIADDNPTNRLVAGQLCEIFGYTSESVSSGVQAVGAALSGRFDLVLMDIKMPEMDGVEATRSIRSGPGVFSQVPIIALTANADPSDAAFYRRCGMNGVVQKPINPAELGAAINAVLAAAPGEIAPALVA
jgi:CheY-like chemotaxis protein